MPCLQSPGHVGRNSGLPVDQTRQRHTRNTELPCGFRHRQIQSRQDVLADRLTRVRWIVHSSHDSWPLSGSPDSQRGRHLRPRTQTSISSFRSPIPTNDLSGRPSMGGASSPAHSCPGGAGRHPIVVTDAPASAPHSTTMRPREGAAKGLVAGVGCQRYQVLVTAWDIVT